jgi:tRNA G18 (ribose-2'-O)-methylase SpoU
MKIIASLAEGGESCYRADYSDPVCLLIGSEASGLTPEILADADLKVSIPQAGAAESLSVSVAAGILMYEIAKHKSLETKPASKRKGAEESECQ